MIKYFLLISVFSLGFCSDLDSCDGFDEIHSFEEVINYEKTNKDSTETLSKSETWTCPLCGQTFSKPVVHKCPP